MVSAVGSAVTVFKEQPGKWRALQLRGMAKDCSWQRAAQQYELVLSEAMADAVQYVRK
jgi:glycogen synthase